MASARFAFIASWLELLVLCGGVRERWARPDPTTPKMVTSLRLVLATDFETPTLMLATYRCAKCGLRERAKIEAAPHQRKAD